MRKALYDRMLIVGIAVFCLISASPVNAQSTAPPGTVSLTDTLYLARAPRTGDVSYFRITREDITVNEKGESTSRTVSTGRFKREVIHGDRAGAHMERYTWKDFFHARTEDMETSVNPAEITAIRGFSYDLSSDDRHSIPPIYIGGLAKTADTFAFFVVAWDVTTLTQAVTTRSGYPVHSLNQIGDRIVGTNTYLPAPFDFTPIVSGFSYVRQPFTTMLAGLSTIDQNPVALIRFKSGDNPISYRFADGRAAVSLDGREWTSGTVYVRLSDKAMMRGELQTTVVVSQDILMPGKQTHHSMTVFQDVVLEMISEQAYEE